jgi:hypothetical protein
VEGAAAPLASSSCSDASKVTAPVKRKRPESPEGNETDADRTNKETLPGHTDGDDSLGADGGSSDVSASGSDAEADSQSSEGSTENPATSTGIPQTQYKHRFKRARFEEAAVATGEEHEIAVYQGRAKAFVLDKRVEGGKWRECGIGPIRLNVRTDIADKVNGKKCSPDLTSPPVALAGPIARILMRQEHKPGGRGNKVLINAALWTGMTVQLHASDVTAVQLNAYVSEIPKVLLDDKKSTPAAATTTISGTRKDKERSTEPQKAASVIVGKQVDAAKEAEGGAGKTVSTTSSAASGSATDKGKDALPSIHDPFHFLLRFGRPELAKEFVSAVGRYKESLAPFFHLPVANAHHKATASTVDVLHPTSSAGDASIAAVTASAAPSSVAESILPAPTAPSATQEESVPDKTSASSSSKDEV